MKKATIQVDVDGLWTNLAFYGHSHPVADDPLIKTALPRFLEIFHRYGVKATFFWVGKDLEIPWKASLAKKLVAAGHEIANHTYSHPFGFASLSKKEQATEIDKCAEIIKKITTSAPQGFKAPGYDISPVAIQHLASRGYVYDSSILPTPFYQPAVAMHRWRAGGKKRTHGPKWYWLLAPNKTYHSGKKVWCRGSGSLLEVPNSVTPWCRLPFHSTFVFALGWKYFALVSPLVGHLSSLNYEFHVADLADFMDPRLTHLNKPLSKRIALVEKILHSLCKEYEFVTTSNFVRGKRR